MGGMPLAPRPSAHCRLGPGTHNPLRHTCKCTYVINNMKTVSRNYVFDVSRGRRKFMVLLRFMVFRGSKYQRPDLSFTEILHNQFSEIRNKIASGTTPLSSRPRTVRHVLATKKNIL